MEGTPGSESGITVTGGVVEAVLAVVAALVDARALLAGRRRRQGCQRLESVVDARDKLPRSQQAAKKTKFSAEAMWAS